MFTLNPALRIGIWIVASGAGGTRTHMLLRAEDFKSSASANSATAPAGILISPDPSSSF